MACAGAEVSQWLDPADDRQQSTDNNISQVYRHSLIAVISM